MVQLPMEWVITVENLKSQEEVRMREGNERSVTQEEPLNMGKGLVTSASKLVIIKG